MTANIKFSLLLMLCVAVLFYGFGRIWRMCFVRRRLKKSQLALLSALVLLAFVGCLMHYSLFELVVNVLMEFKFM